MPSKNNFALTSSLLFIIFLAFAIRLKGVWFGYPLPVHPDEPMLVDTALSMINTGDLNPHFFNYPTLNIYLQAILYKFTQLFTYVFLNIPSEEIPTIWYFIIGRIFNAFISTITIFIVFIIGRKLFSPLSGLFSTPFLAFSFLHVSNSFLVTVDSSVAFWASLTTFMAVLIYSEESKTKYYVYSGIFIGLAISSKYTAFVCSAPLLIAHIARNYNTKKWINKNIILGLIFIPVTFLITSPYSILDYHNFISAIQFESAHYQSGHPGAQSDTSTSYFNYGMYLFTEGYGEIPIILAGMGLLILIRKSPIKAILIIIIPLLLYIFIGRYKVYFPRNIVAALPFLSLLSGITVSVIYQELCKILSFLSKPIRVSISSIVLVIALSSSIWQQATSSVNYVVKITLPDTRWVSLQWIERNLPPGSHIGREHYTPPIENYSNKFKIKYLGFCAVTRTPSEMKTIDYMIVSSGDYSRFTEHPEKYPDESNTYINFFKQNELVKQFVPDEMMLGGPTIGIYKIH